MADLIIAGNIVSPEGVKYSQVLVDTDKGVIKKIGNNLGVSDFIAGDDSLIFAGFIDLHVHSREDASGKQNHKEDFKTVSNAGINGGVTYIADMPNNPVPPVDDKSFKEKEALTGKSDVGVLLYAGIGQKTRPLKKHVPYKVFMGQSVGDLFFESNNELEKAMEKYSGKSVSFHCEDESILTANKNEATHEKQRPREAEITAIKFALELIKKYRLQGKICHCSTMEGLELIKQAKGDGVNVTCEVTPHHMYFDEKDVKNNLLKMNPPLRTGKDRIALIEGLKKGDIDYLATDHAPHLITEKEQGMAGVPHLDTYSKIASWLIKSCGLSPEDIARVCSYNPGRFIGEFTAEKLGLIEEGYSANLTIINLEKEEKVTKEMIKSKCGWSPFEGEVLPGIVEALFIDGRRFY
mgnify:CR=1 FL=1